MAAFASALLGAAAATAWLVRAVVPPGVVSGPLVGAAALPLAVVVLLRLDLPLSTWQVPRGWARCGHVCYSAAFGAALGPGVVTRLPSPALLLVLAWPAAAASWPQAVAPAAAFALARAATTIVVVGTSTIRRRHPVAILGGWSGALRGLPALEAAALVAIAAAGISP